MRRQSSPPKRPPFRIMVLTAPGKHARPLQFFRQDLLWLGMGWAALMLAAAYVGFSSSLGQSAASKDSASFSGAASASTAGLGARARSAASSTASSLVSDSRQK